MYCIDVIIAVLLTIDSHALQGYSSCLCLCVRFDFSIQYELAKKTYGLPQHCKRFNLNMHFSHKTASSQSYRLLVEVTRAGVSHFVCLC